MQAVQLVLPTLATLAFGTALLVPLREDQRAKRASLRRAKPLRPDFRVVVPAAREREIEESAVPSQDVSFETLESSTSRQALASDGWTSADDSTDDRDASNVRNERGIGIERDGSGGHVGGSTRAGEHDKTSDGVVTAASEQAPGSAESDARGFRDLWQRLRTLGNGFSFERMTPNRKPFLKSSDFSGTTDAAAIVTAPPDPKDVTCERTFQNELARLLLPQRPSAVGSADGETSNDAHHAPSANGADSIVDAGDTNHPTDAFFASDANDAPGAKHPKDGDDGDRARGAYAGNVSKATSAIDAGTASNDAIAISIARASVNARLPKANDRVVPLTRLPLRPESGAVTWPSELNAAHSALTSVERLALLTACGTESMDAPITILELAYAQEDRDGRLAALRAISRRHPTERTRATLAEALRCGTDEERSLALDALARHGRRDDYIVALGDRIDAIAARAALGFVGSYERRDYPAALEPYLDTARIETLLGLLAGIVE